MGRLFGTDGVRGIAGRDITEDLARRLGRAAAVVLPRHGDRPAFVLGRDTRASGESLQAAMAEGIRSAGGTVFVAGVQTTPAVAFLTAELGASSGLVISASHNPPEYNGIKFFGADGQKLSDELEAEIESLIDESGGTSEAVGAIRPIEDATERYLQHLVQAAETKLDGWKVVVDCANGAAYEAAPEALRRLGAEVLPVFDQPDGRNINVECGAMHSEVVGGIVVREGADAGVAHDGDADRAMFADAVGEQIDGDHVLAACALAMKSQGRLEGNVVVSTVMANLGFRKAMEEAGIELVTTKVGDRYVLEEMLRTGAVIGGEQSGHVIFREHASTGDGILTAIKVLTFAAASGATLREFVSVMRRYPQVLINVEVSDQGALDGAGQVWDEIRAVERALDDRGRVLVRASGTEPLVRVMVEAETEDEAERGARAIADRVRTVLG